MEERRNGLHPTAPRQERFQGTGRITPSKDLSFRVKLRGFQLPSNFPGPDSTVDEARSYLLGPKPYSHRGYPRR